MKRFLIALFFLLGTYANTMGQMPNGSIAPDFTLQDIDGHTHHLYDYLDSGKVVILDFFEVMCGPCWNYHETHALAHAFNAWGPGGTNELMIFEVEGIKSSINQIRGLTPPTYGNWTEGEPFPFIETCLPNNNKIVSDYMVNFFPSVYLICRDRRVKLIGTADTAAIHAQMHNCPAAPSDSLFLDLVKIDSAKVVTCTNSIHPYLKFQNYGTKTIHSAKISVSMDGQAPEILTWSGELKTYAILQFDGKNFTQVPDGSHTIQYLITELNGSATGFKRDTLSYRFSNIQYALPLPYSQTFTDPLFPYNNWTIDNPYKSIPTWERADLGYAGALRIPYFNIPTDYTSALYIPAMLFSGISGPCMRFEMACTHNNSVIKPTGYDLIEFDYSTDCGVTWELMAQLSELDYQSAPDDSTYFIPTESQWKPVVINVPKVANKPLVMFRLLSSPAAGNNMYLKNIRFDNSAGFNEEIRADGVFIYPVPSRDVIHIIFGVAQMEGRFELYDPTGVKLRTTLFTGGKKASVGIENLIPGCYFLRIITPGSSIIRKIIVCQ